METTWQLTEDRRAAKYRVLTGNEEERTAVSDTYWEVNTAVKKYVRQDKRSYTTDLAQDAQSASERGDTRTVYKITKTLMRGFTHQTTVATDTNGKLPTNDKVKLNRLAGHFKETLNRQDPDEEAVIKNTGFRAEIKRGGIAQ